MWPVNISVGLESDFWVFGIREERGTYISTATQHKQSHQNQKHIQHKPPNTSNPPARDPPRAIISLSHPHVRRSPEDKPEEGIEQRTHQTEQVREERDDFRDDEG